MESKIKAFLQDHGPATSFVIAARMEATTHEVEPVLRSMVEAGSILVFPVMMAEGPTPAIYGLSHPKAL